MRLRSRGGSGCRMDVTGADGGTRTRNLLFTKQLLYQLSYVGATGRALPQKTLRRRGMIGPLAGSGQAWGSVGLARSRRPLLGSVGREEIGPLVVRLGLGRAVGGRRSSSACGSGGAGLALVVAGRSACRPRAGCLRSRDLGRGGLAHPWLWLRLRLAGAVAVAAASSAAPFAGTSSGSVERPLRTRGFGFVSDGSGFVGVADASVGVSAAAAGAVPWPPLATLRPRAFVGGSSSPPLPSAGVTRGVAFGSRCASASNSRIDPATAAFSDPTAPFIGMRMNRSARRRTAGPRPWPSLPTTIASGPRRSL